MTEATEIKPKRKRGRQPGDKVVCRKSPKGINTVIQARVDWLVEQFSKGIPPNTIRTVYQEKFGASSFKPWQSDCNKAFAIIHAETEKTRPNIVGMLRAYSTRALDLAVSRVEQGKAPPSEILKCIESIGKLYGLEQALAAGDNRAEPMQIVLTHQLPPGESHEIIDITPEPSESS